MSKEVADIVGDLCRQEIELFEEGILITLVHRLDVGGQIEVHIAHVVYEPVAELGERSDEATFRLREESKGISNSYLAGFLIAHVHAREHASEFRALQVLGEQVRYGRFDERMSLDHKRPVGFIISIERCEESGFESQLLL